MTAPMADVKPATDEDVARAKATLKAHPTVKALPVLVHKLIARIEADADRLSLQRHEALNDALAAIAGERGNFTRGEGATALAIVMRKIRKFREQPDLSAQRQAVDVGK